MQFFILTCWFNSYKTQLRSQHKCNNNNNNNNFIKTAILGKSHVIREGYNLRLQGRVVVFTTGSREVPKTEPVIREHNNNNNNNNNRRYFRYFRAWFGRKVKTYTFFFPLPTKLNYIYTHMYIYIMYVSVFNQKYFTYLLSISWFRVYE
jgi:hypothetical protein